MRELWNKLINTIRILFGGATQTTTNDMIENNKYVENYRDSKKINFTAIFSNKFAKYTMSQSKISIDGDSKKAKYLNEIIKRLNKKMKKIVSLSYGTGGAFIIPFVQNKKLLFKYVEQNRVTIDSMSGDLITGATLLAETKTITENNKTKQFLRWSNYKVKNNTLTITQKYTDGDCEEIECPLFWQDITQVFQISGVDRVLMGYIKCPIDNRNSEDLYGVPITYGNEDTIEELHECIEQIKREFKLKQAFVGADFTLFKDNVDLSENGLYRKLDKEDFWEVFDPAIRDSSYFNRLQELYTRLENGIGSSKGILAKVENANVTATETKKNMFDSFTIVDDMRVNIEDGTNDFVYSCDKLCDAYKLCPSGEYETKYDWSYDLLEDSNQTFSQLMQGQSKGVVKDAEVRQFIYPSETMEESEKAVEEIKKSKPDVKTLVGE